MLLLALACVRQTPDASGSTGTPPEPDPVKFTAMGFNTESGGSDPATVATEVVADLTGESLWGFAEVQDEAAGRLYVEAAADPGEDQQWDSVLGTTGYTDRLLLAWDDARWELLSSEELTDINVGGTVRAPLVGHLRERASGLELLFVVNHLWRTDEPARHEQAALLNGWGREQSLPVVMVGDYNFDWDVGSGVHDEGYDELVAGDVFRWVEPETLVATQCSRSYDSVLDFVFVGGEARSWSADSDVLRTDDTYCSSSHETTWSDHRPVRARFETR